MPTQTINLNDALPAAPAGSQNIKWQADPPSLDPTVVRDVSAFMPAATNLVNGAVRPDGTIIVVDPSGKIIVSKATAAGLGVVKPDSASIAVAPDGTISANMATLSALGIVKPDGVTIDIDGGGKIFLVGSTPANTHAECLTDGNSNFIFAGGDIVTVLGVPN